MARLESIFQNEANLSAKKKFNYVTERGRLLSLIM
jgi:hypothetical protein